MDDTSYRDLGLRAEANVRQKLAVIHETFGLDRAARWTCDGTDDSPTFTIWDRAGTPLFRSEAVEVGTFNHERSTWKWGWCNPSLPPEHQNRMLALRELADLTGQELFRSDQPFAVSVDTASVKSRMRRSTISSALRALEIVVRELHTYGLKREFGSRERIAPAAGTVAP